MEPISVLLRAIGDPIGGVVNVGERPGVDLTLQDARHYFDYHHTAADTFDKVRIEEFAPKR